MTIPTVTIDQIIPEGPLRKAVYRIFAAAGLILGATQVGFAAAQAGQPVWLTVALAVYAFAASAGFQKAQANVPVHGDAVVETHDFEGEPDEDAIG